MTKQWQLLLLGIIFGLLSSAIILLVSTQPRGQPITLLPTLTLAPIKVYIVGAVVNPGVYDLPRSSRVKDAVLSAGGLLENANQNVINLAAHIIDEQKIIIPTIPVHSTGEPKIDQKNGNEQTASPDDSFPININTATLEEFDTLPGIGAKKAEDIVLYRQTHGLFINISEIKDVPGIGEALFLKIEPFITITP
jgi:competence protein ComEA